jgi:hypothetical protein
VIACVKNLNLVFKRLKIKQQHDNLLFMAWIVVSFTFIPHLSISIKLAGDPIQYYVATEDMHPLIKTAHIRVGQGGIHKTNKELRRQFANISRIFGSNCEQCILKRKRSEISKLVAKPILSADFNPRGQVDLVDFQSVPDNEYTWIMHYQDHFTKFSVLRPLKYKKAAEVAYNLLDIFILLEAPHILQSDNGREFTANIITDLRSLWQELVIVHGKPRHPQSQGSVERANADIKEMIISWMNDNDTNPMV